MAVGPNLNNCVRPPKTLMTTTLINLTLAIVNEEAELLAEYCPNPIYQDVLGNPIAKQELMTYVLSRIPNTYVLTAAPKTMNARGQTTAYRLQIETLLKQGIDSVCCYRPMKADFRETQKV